MICLDLAKSSFIILPDGSKVTPDTHETCTEAGPNGNFRGCSGASLDPVITDRFAANSNGEVKFGFENKKDEQHVKFSGITVRKVCEKTGKKFRTFVFKFVF